MHNLKIEEEKNFLQIVIQYNDIYFKTLQKFRPLNLRFLSFFEFWFFLFLFNRYQNQNDGIPDTEMEDVVQVSGR